MTQTTLSVSEPYQAVYERLQPFRQKVLDHPLYRRLQTLDDLQALMESHVYAVWDFMILVKALQMQFAGTSLPWLPHPQPQVSRFINEIVLSEETDEVEPGLFLSHYAYYRQAMEKVGASTGSIDRWLECLRQGWSVEQALGCLPLRESVRSFVQTTWLIVSEGSLVEVAAAFNFGREELIPSMFSLFVDQLESRYPNRVDLLQNYLIRHIELDGDDHGPMAQRLLEALCGHDEMRWESCYKTGARVLEARVRLWDGVLAQIEGQPEPELALQPLRKLTGQPSVGVVDF